MTAGDTMETTSTRKFIQAGGGVGGIVPQVDAPTSASNSGERRVTIRCQQSSISLPVTPDTSPEDLLYSSANLMTQDIDPGSSDIVEWYFSFGLQRRLRRYERVRDVLNSWERDSQHSLLIVPADGSSSPSIPGDGKKTLPTSNDLDLSIESVPRCHDAPPGLVNFPLYHSQKPGRWSKRLVTLNEAGQVFSHKKHDAKVSDKDASVLCNLSDFDLYDVVERDMLRSLRPPKRHCFAIKSQQKTSVFLNTQNFVHFFSVDDNRLARGFRACVHEWRSWYLVNKKVDLVKREKAQHRSGADAHGIPDSNSGDSNVHNSPDAVAGGGGGHRPNVSVDESPYTIGTFQPLVNMDRFDKPLEEFGHDPLPAERRQYHEEPRRRKTLQKDSQHRSRETPTYESANRLVNDATSPVQSPESAHSRIDPFAKDQEFRSSGLLGKAYEGRKQQQQFGERSSDENQYYSPTGGEGPFTGGLLQEAMQQQQQQQYHHYQPSRDTASQAQQFASSNPRISRSNTTRTTRSTRTQRGRASPTEQPPLEGRLPFRSHSGTQVNSPPSNTSPPAASPASASPASRLPASDSTSWARQREKPQPLLDISSPDVPDLPANWRENISRGHGVKAPSGAPLISMATDSRVQWQPPGMGNHPSYSPNGGSPVMTPTAGNGPTSPPATREATFSRSGSGSGYLGNGSGSGGGNGAVGLGLGRRSTTKSTPSDAAGTLRRSASTATSAVPASRRRSQSAAATGHYPPTSSSSTAGGRRVVSNERDKGRKAPPVPSLPKKHSSRHDDDEDVPLINFVQRSSGRTGTLKHV